MKEETDFTLQKCKMNYAFFTLTGMCLVLNYKRKP